MRVTTTVILGLLPGSTAATEATEAIEATGAIEAAAVKAPEGAEVHLQDVLQKPRGPRASK
jgi:hypothetical protein